MHHAAENSLAWHFLQFLENSLSFREIAKTTVKSKKSKKSKVLVKKTPKNHCKIQKTQKIQSFERDHTAPWIPSLNHDGHPWGGVISFKTLDFLDFLDFTRVFWCFFHKYFGFFGFFGLYNGFFNFLKWYTIFQKNAKNDELNSESLLSCDDVVVCVLQVDNRSLVLMVRLFLKRRRWLVKTRTDSSSPQPKKWLSGRGRAGGRF